MKFNYKKILIFVVIVTLVFVILTYVKKLILYHPIVASPVKYDRFYKKISQLSGKRENICNFRIKTSDGILLDTLYLKKSNSKMLIIFFHGNAGNLSMRHDMIKFLYNYASVIVFDYRCFGKSTGDNSDLSCAGLERDAMAVWNYVVNNLKIRPNNISLFGESLGCSVAIQLAATLSKTMNQTNYPHSLILNSPFYSLASMIKITFDKYHIGFLGTFISYFIGNEYQSDQQIKYINHRTKIIVAHSLQDEIVPYKEGKKLYDLINTIRPDTKFINIMGTHNNMGLTDNYIYALSDLFDDDL